MRYFAIQSAILFLFSYSLQSQTFNFTRTSDPIVYTNDTAGAVSNATINNLTGAPFEIRLIKAVLNLPPGWETCICDIIVCHPPGVDTAIATYPVGSSLVSVILYAHSIPGTGYVTLRAEKVSNPSEHYNVIFGGAYNPIGIRQISSVVNSYNLAQNYPNPFNPSTKINFSIPDKEFVTLKVYDILGREMKTLANSEYAPGEYEVTFDSDGLASGIYYYTLVSGNFVSVKKMVMVK